MKKRPPPDMIIISPALSKEAKKTISHFIAEVKEQKNKNKKKD